jgi:hypothetical protein
MDGETDRHDNRKWELLFEISWMFLKINSFKSEQCNKKKVCEIVEVPAVVWQKTQVFWKVMLSLGEQFPIIHP